MRVKSHETSKIKTSYYFGVNAKIVKFYKRKEEKYE